LKNQLVFAGIIIVALVAVLSLAYIAMNPRPVYLTTTANMVETSFVTETPTSSATMIQTSQTQFTTVEESSAVTQPSCTSSYGSPPCGSVAVSGEAVVTHNGPSPWTLTDTYFEYNGHYYVVDFRSPGSENLLVFNGVVCFSGYQEPNEYTSVSTYTASGTVYTNTMTAPIIWLAGVTSGDCYPP